jgi:hypothetical protein
MLYEVDAQNIVVDVDTEWDAEAERMNGGFGAMRANIVGRPLESFMSGDATKMFVRAALDAARLMGETRVLPYRCDIPGERRHCEMVISPLANGHVKVVHKLVLAVPTAPRHKLRKARALAGWCCSQCCRVRLSGSDEWVESIQQFDSRLVSDVCQDCAKALFSQLE